jgi:hypothetical protein
VSILLICNACVLDAFQLLASRTNRVVTIRPKPEPNFPKGVDIFIHPFGAPESEIATSWAGWLAEVPGLCACGENKKEN